MLPNLKKYFTVVKTETLENQFNQKFNTLVSLPMKDISPSGLEEYPHLETMKKKERILEVEKVEAILHRRGWV